MANPTTNRAYAMPASTDLVTNLPAQFATFGDAIDLDMVTAGGYSTTATGAGTTTLTKTSNRVQYFTGATTQTVVLPVVTTLALGHRWRIVNKSTGIVTVQSSGANTVYAVPAGSTVDFTCILITGTTAASWDYAELAAAAASTAAINKILTASFSAVANTGTTFDGVFTSTYKKYLVILSDMITSSSSGILYLQTRVAAVTKATNYYSACQAYNYAGTGRQDIANNAAQFLLGRMSDLIDSHYNLTFSNVGNASEYPSLSVDGVSGYENGGIFGGGAIATNHLADGFILSASVGNISGTATIFGIVN